MKPTGTHLTLLAGLLVYGMTATARILWLGQPPAVAYIPRSVLVYGTLGFFAAVFLASLLAATALALAVVPSLRRRALAALLAAVLVLASVPIVERVVWHYRREWLHRIVREARPVVAALTEHGRISGQAPDSANSILASASLPSLGGRRLSYTRGAGANWSLSLVMPYFFGTTDTLEYRSDGLYPKEVYLNDGRVDGWYERVEDWAYFHDNDE